MNKKQIINRLNEHLETSLSSNNLDWFVICLQGSQNYGLSDEQSDIDSKLLTLPSLKELVLNLKPYNKVHIMDNEEHCDMKDVREYFKIFRKQNINFVEILFTDYYIVNTKYSDLWEVLIENREKLVRLNEYAAISCMKGMAGEKYHALCHEYPSRMTYIDKYGYDPKQLSHLVRLKNFIENYGIHKKPYKLCLLNDGYDNESLIRLKRNGDGMSLTEAKFFANEIYSSIVDTADVLREGLQNNVDIESSSLLDDVLYELITRKLKDDLK